MNTSTLAGLALIVCLFCVIIIAASAWIAQRDGMSCARQHIADMEILLSELIDARDALDAQINTATYRLLDAHRHHDQKHYEHARRFEYRLPPEAIPTWN